jgi:pimeloyl-[acyl-carrier protein] methyl ester esterase
MKTYIKRREKNDRLLIMYGGWGTDENFFAHFCNDDFDFILFSNYSADEPLVLPEMKTYKKIVLIGWSLGVWAAEYLSPKTGIKADVTIAVNGTPIPADDKYGIPVHVFEGTLNNITEVNMEKFYLRMFGDKKTYDLNKDKVPHRTIQSLHDELRWMYNRMMEQSESGFIWDYAVTSDNDRVFPANNLKTYWKKQISTRHIIVPMPHYFFHNWQSYEDFIIFVESHKKKKAYKKKTTPAITTGLL